MIAQAGGNDIFLGVAALDANHVALCEQYANGGFLCADFETRAFLAQSEDFCVADPAWKIILEDHAPKCFNTPYALSRRQGAWKVFCVTAHEEQRPWAEND